MIIPKKIPFLVGKAIPVPPLTIDVVVSATEKTRITAAATRAHQTVSVWCLAHLLKATSTPTSKKVPAIVGKPVVIKIPVKPTEKTRIEAAAKKAGLAVPGWSRKQLLASA